MYLTYEEYTELGGTLAETEFRLLEFESRSLIDYYTFNRLQKEDTIPEAVKMCIMLIISLMDNYKTVSGSNDIESNTNSTSGIKSQSNDGVSISYNVASADTLVKKFDNEVYNTIKRSLSGIKNSLGQYLLYRGLYPGE